MLRGHARLRIAETTVVSARALRVAQHGVNLLVERSVQTPQRCAVAIDLFVRGAPRHIRAVGEVVSCSCAGMEGFRIAMRFMQMDDDSAAEIQRLLA